MKSITVNIDKYFISGDILQQYKEQLTPEIVRSTQQPYAFCDVIHKSAVQSVTSAAAAKKALNPTLLFVIGIGGSTLGTQAIAQALLGSCYNDSTDNMRVYYLDTIDADYINTLLILAEQALSAAQSIIVNVISKSGNTTETIVNFELFLALLKKYHPHHYSDYIVVTTDKDSPLWHLAQQEQWRALEIPQELGGRYSVFSAVGLFPLAMLNIDVHSLLRGARYATTLCLQHDQANSAAMSAAWHYALCKEGYNISNLFLFSNALSSIGAWWRQLVAESLGKGTKKNGASNHDVMLPIVSMGPTDLHSIGQLYLADVTPIVTTFVSFEHNQSLITIDLQQDSPALIHNIRGKTTTTIMQSLLQGVKQAYTIKQLPYRSISIPEKNAYYMGHLLQQYMFEIVYIAYLFDINPFDQPAVELYKQETRKILNNE